VEECGVSFMELLVLEIKAAGATWRVALSFRCVD
jgi:hypothetical protein